MPAPSMASVAVDRVLFSDSMVLQRQMPLPVWGAADPGEAVTVTFSNQSKSTIAAGDGMWSVRLDPVDAGTGPSDLIISGSNSLVVHDVVVGEVWVCSGQSNMRGGTPPRGIQSQYPDVRTLKKRRWRDRPSATCFWFGVGLNRALGVPIGLINRAVDGSSIVSWLGSTAGSDPDPSVQALLSRLPKWGLLYDREIAPLQPYAIRGIAWWQGEKDAYFANNYRHFLPALIRSWRSDWSQGDFPFLYVQLPTGGGLRVGELPPPLPTRPAAHDLAPPMRDAYIEALSQSNTGIVISTDLDGGLHPRNKQDYGERFARLALGGVYGQDIASSGPVYQSMDIEGSTVRIHFRAGTASTLLALGGGPVEGFEIAGADRKFAWADAQIDGSDVLVSSPEVLQPASVRYAWANFPKWANLVNDLLLAAAPFSTDHGPLAVPPTFPPSPTATSTVSSGVPTATATQLANGTPTLPAATQTPTLTKAPAPSATVFSTWTPTKTPTASATATPLPSCGNGQVDPGEQCDDGNRVSGDGCSSACTVEVDKLIPGGGVYNCLHEWLTIPPPAAGPNGLPVNQVGCVDDDPSCDFGSSTGDATCTFRLAQCFNVVDPRLVCTPSALQSVEILVPSTSQSDATDLRNRSSLTGALVGFGGQIRGVCVNTGPLQWQFCTQSPDCDSTPGSGNGVCHAIVDFAPTVAATNVCTSYAEVKVPLRKSTTGFSTGIRPIRVRAIDASGSLLDVDWLQLVCEPRL